MRVLETEVRKEKEIVAGLKAAGDTEGAKLHRKRIKALRGKYDNICDQTGLQPHTERMRMFRVTENDKNIIQNAKTKTTLPLENNGGSGIMKESTKRTIQQSPVNNQTSVSQKNIGMGSALWSEEKRTNMFRTEKILVGNQYETAVIYNSDGSLAFKKKGDANSVFFSKQELNKMKGKIITHNHPKGGCFSPEDIALLRQTGAAEIRAATKNGTFVINPPDVWSDEISSFKRLDEMYNKYIDNAIIKSKDIAAREGKPLLSYLHQAEIEGTKAFCDKYGLIFRMEVDKL